jgi:hypothetical protein
MTRLANAFVALSLLLSIAPAATAQQQLDARVEVAWNRYYPLEQVESILHRLAEAYPELLTLESIGTSEQGRPLWLVTLNNPATGPAREKPAMWIDGSIHPNEIQATEVVLYSIWYLCSAYGVVPSLTELVDRAAFYFVPVMNPDGRVAWFETAVNPHMFRSGLRPTDLDLDGRADEDHPRDLTGTGSINVMWRKDPRGTHRRNAKDPRIFERVEPGEWGEWSFAGWEGIDEDGDGQINEDAIGGYDMNRNLPSGWQPNHVQRGAGAFPLSYPETQAMAEFLYAHPNIAAGQSYHNTGGMLLRGPGAAFRSDQYPAEDVRVYDELGKAGEEMLPFYNYWVIHADLYTVHGGFVTWMHEGLGIVSFTNELWTDRRILQDGNRQLSPQQRMRWEDRVLFGQTFDEFVPFDHPDLGAVLIGGGTRYSSRIAPPFMLEEECHRNFAFTIFHAMQMPRLSFAFAEATPLGDDLWQVTVEVENDRIIPTRTEIARRNRIGLPDRMILEGAEVLASGTLDHRFDRQMTPTEHRPARILDDRGVPGRGYRVFRFIVKAPRGSEILLRYEAQKARDIERSLRLGEGP